MSGAKMSPPSGVRSGVTPPPRLFGSVHFGDNHCHVCAMYQRDDLGDRTGDQRIVAGSSRNSGDDVGGDFHRVHRKVLEIGQVSVIGGDANQRYLGAQFSQRLHVVHHVTVATR